MYTHLIDDSGLQIHWCTSSRAETSERLKDEETIPGPSAPIYCMWDYHQRIIEQKRIFRSF